MLFPLSLVAGDFSPATPMPSASLDDDKLISRIVVGSCFHPSLPAGIFDEIAEQEPDAFLFAGDNVYAADESDDPELKSLKQAYSNLANVASFTRLRKTVPVLPVWDDHDYGLDDAGGDWPRKQTAEALYEHVWAIPGNDPRASRDGIYFERITGPEGQRVQLILLDTRFFRTPLTRNPGEKPPEYIPTDDPDQSMLGEEQWQWFEQQLRKPADVRIIVSSTLLLSEVHGWEAWRQMPAERQRFYNLLKTTQANGVVIASGDTHNGGIYRADDKIDYPLLELNASSLNVPLTTYVKNPKQVPGVYRLGDTYVEANYGVIDINWQQRHIDLRLVSDQGDTVRQAGISISELGRHD